MRFLWVDDNCGSEWRPATKQDHSCVRQVQQKRGDRVTVGKGVRLIHKRSGRARLRQPEPRRDRARALALSQSNRFVNRPSRSL